MQHAFRARDQLARAGQAPPRLAHLAKLDQRKRVGGLGRTRRQQRRGITQARIRFRFLGVDEHPQLEASEIVGHGIVVVPMGIGPGAAGRQRQRAQVLLGFAQRVAAVESATKRKPLDKRIGLARDHVAELIGRQILRARELPVIERRLHIQVLGARFVFAHVDLFDRSPKRRAEMGQQFVVRGQRCAVAVGDGHIGRQIRTL